MSDKQKIENYLKTLSVAKELEIVSNKDTLTPYMLHITIEPKPEYKPRIGSKQARSEDRTVPRVTVTDTLLGCIIGYALLTDDVYEHINYKSSYYFNGFTIRKLPFEYCLKPTNKLLFDAKLSNEYWLVPYSENTTEYKSEVIGQFYIPEMTVISKGPDRNQPDKILTVKLRALGEMYISDTVKVDKGYYQFQVVFNQYTSYRSKIIDLESITEEVYKDTGGLVKSPLSVSNTSRKAIYARW